MLSRPFLGAMLLAISLVSTARADISLGDLSDHRFTVSFLGGDQTLTQAAGSNYAFTVILSEEILSGPDPFLISDPAWGMSSASFNVRVTGPSQVTTITGNSAFDSPNAFTSPTLATMSQSGSTVNVFGSTTTRSLTLGTISGTVQNGSTLLQLFDDPTINELSSIGAKFFNLDPGPGMGDTTVLPFLSLAGGTITLNSITAVPEPGSMALVASVLAGSIAWRWKRRKQNAPIAD